MIADYVGALLILVGFTWLLLRLRLAERSGLIGGIVLQSATTAADRSLDDEVKAKAMRGYSLQLFGLFATLALGLALAIGLPVLLVWLMAFTGIWNFQGAIAATVSWPFLIAGLAPLIWIFLRSERRHDG